MRIAILTRSYNSIEQFISLLKKRGININIVLEYPYPVTLSKKKYSFLQRLDINLYRVLRKIFFYSKKSQAPIEIHRLNEMDGNQINAILRKNEIDTLLLKNAPIIKKTALSELDKHIIINAHSGLLPYYKGASCGFWPIVENNDKLGVTLHHVTAKLDEGEIICRKQIPLSSIPFSFKYPVIINKFQLIGLADCVQEFTKNRSLHEVDNLKKEVSKYYSLPTLTSYYKGLVNLYKNRK